MDKIKVAASSESANNINAAAAAAMENDKLQTSNKTADGSIKIDKQLSQNKSETKHLLAEKVGEKKSIVVPAVKNAIIHEFNDKDHVSKIDNKSVQGVIRNEVGDGKIREPPIEKKRVTEVTKSDQLIKKRGIAESGNLTKAGNGNAAGIKKPTALSLTTSNQNFNTKHSSNPQSKFISPSMYSLKINAHNDVFSPKNGVSQSFSTTEVNRINLATNKNLLDANFANKSLASIAMGSTDGKKLFIRRVPTSPTELLNLNTNAQMSHMMTSTGATTTSDELSTCSSYSDSISDAGSHFKPRKRDHWTSKVQFILACVGYSIGIGNLWRFPYLCYKSGGGVFLVPYFIILFLCGIPILYMELAVGQYTRRGPIGVLSKLCPIFKGAGISSVIISFFMSTYYNVIIAYSLYYFSASFRSQLPWQQCNNRWNTHRCWTPPDVSEAEYVNVVQNLTKPEFSKTPSEEFYKYG